MPMYDENGDLKELEIETNIVTCKNCRKKYKQLTFEQIPGFRDMSEDECPYCGFIHHKSMSIDYSNYKLED